jgi:superfamily II DNA or RNA helicase
VTANWLADFQQRVDYYGINHFGRPLIKNFDSEEIDVEFIKKLRPVQEEVCNKCINHMIEKGGGLLSVPCGFGKTVCAIYMAAKLGLKTLVIVHKSFLIKQWIRNILDFLNIDESKVLTNIQNYGNTTSATLPLLLNDFESKFKKGDNLVFTSFGGGFTWGSIYLKWAYNK